MSHVDHKTRWPESFCNPDFVVFVCDELLPWLTAECQLPGDVDATLVGLSLTGLSGAHVALHSRGRFSRVVCQSGSFWWEGGQLIDEVAGLACADVTFRITIGDEETKAPVDHGDGLVQEEPQLDSNRRMRDALRAKGFSVSYDEFSGGHEIAPWRDDLPGSLINVYGELS